MEKPSSALTVGHQWQPRGGEDVLILDNRDSFVFNLAHRFFEIGKQAAVLRSDTIDLEGLIELSPAALVVSPGPGHPSEAGVSVEAIRHFAGKIPILGVCLGHQAIAVAFGGRVEPGGKPVHGMSSVISHDGTGMLCGVEKPTKVGRYHSLVVTECPEVLRPTAWCDGFVMAFTHRHYRIEGVQFHPESVLTEQGIEMLANFCDAQ